MSTTRNSMRMLAGLGVSLTLVMSQAFSAAPAAASGGQSFVEVVNLRVDGRHDQPLGIDNPNPLLAWQMVESGRAWAHPCRWARLPLVCPGDSQTAYQIQAATSESNLRKGRLLWDSGKVASAVQSGVRYGGQQLASRQRVVWRVRVWDANRFASDWSAPSSWEMGLLQQSDWGTARWIEYPGRTEAQPMPIFAKQFTVDRRKQVSSARLYVSGVGLHLATLNGRQLS